MPIDPAQFRRKARLFTRRVLKPNSITIDGLKVCTDPDVVPRPLLNVLFKGDHKIPERTAVKRTLRPDDRVLELGAAAGLVSLTCARIVGGDQLLSYEANERFLPVIKENFRLNGMRPNARAKAISRSGGDIPFHFADNMFTSSLFKTTEPETKLVPSDTLDDVIAEFRPTAIVIDIEGGEIDAFADSNLEGIRAIVMELHRHIVGDEAIDQMLDRLVGLGFEREDQGSSTVTILTRELA